MRVRVFTAAVAAAILVSVDLYLWFSRTEEMAAVSLSRLFFALAFQAIGVVGIVTLSLSTQAAWRRFLEDTHKALPWVLTVGGVLFGIALAVGALHYGNCARWDFNRGFLCHG